MLATGSIGVAIPLFLSQKANATGAFSSTNAQNVLNNWANVTQTAATDSSVTLKFTNPRGFASCFEYRSDGDTSQATSPNNYNPAATDGLYPFYCLNNSTRTQEIPASSYVEVRMVFDAEADERFDWTRFDLTIPVCTYDFTAQKMWEVTWGYDFEHRNGGAPVFDMASNGGLTSLDGATVPSYMNSSWHWIYIVDNGQNRHHDYGFADGTIRTVDVTYSTVAGCHIPNIVWGIIPPDTTAPIANITNLAGQFVSGNIVTIKGSATDETDFKYYYCYVSLPGSSEVGVRDGNCTTTWNSVSNGTLGTVDMTGLADGNYDAHLVAYDKAGNHSDLNYSVAFKVDNTVPTGLNLTFPLNNAILNSSNLYLDWSDASDDVTPSSQIEYHYQLYMVNPDTNPGAALRYSANYTGTTQHPAAGFAPGTPEGTYWWRVQACDQAGNCVTTPAQKFTIDNANPAVSISNVSVSNGANKIATINGVAIDTNFNYYYCYVTGSGGEVGVRDNLCQTAWAAGTPFKTAFAPTVTGQPSGVIGSVDLSGLPTGTYTAHLVAKDKAGNQTDTADYLFNVDNTAPILTVGDYTGTSLTPTLIGTTDGATDIVTVDGVAVTIPLALNDDGTYDWAYTLPAQAVGSYTFNVVSTDDLGNNTSPKVANVTIQPTPLVPTSQLQTTNAGGGTLPVATLAPPATFTPQATATPGEVLGDQTTTPSADTSNAASNNTKAATDNGSVLGSSTNRGWNILGVAWYWWLLIVAAIVAVAWWLLAGYRRRAE